MTDPASPPPSFGDHARILPSPETEALGVVGRVGVVYGESVPSSSGVGPVVGDRGADFTYNVDFEDGSEGLWYAPHLVEFVDHAPGMVIEVGGHRFVREASGAWAHTPPPPPSAPAPEEALRGPAERSPADFLGRLLDRLWPRG